MFKANLVLNGDAAANTTAAKRVSREIHAALKEGRRYGKYIILGCEDGYRTVESTVADSCFDPRSLMFVTRTAAVESGMFTLVSVALSADGETEDVKFTLAAPFKKLAGVPLTVSVSVEIDETRDCAALVGGDNPLVRWLLGEGDLGTAKISLGSNRSALGIAPPPSGGIYRSHAATAVFTDSGVEFRATGSGTPVEAFLTLNGTACVRSLPLAASSEVLTGSGRCQMSGTFAIMRECIEIMSVTADGVPVTDYDIEWGRDSMGKGVSTGIVMASAPTFAPDGDFKRVAAVSGDEALVFRVADRRPVIEAQRRIYGQEKLVRTTRDGALICYDGERAVLITPDGDEFKHALEPFDDWQAVCLRQGKYTLVVRRGSSVSVCELTESGITVTETVAAGEQCAIGCVDGRRLLICGLAVGGRVIGDSASEIEDCVQVIFDDFGATDLKISGHLITFLSDGLVYIVDLTVTDGFELDSGESTFSGEVCTQGRKVYLSNPAGTVNTISNVTVDSTVTSYCRLREFVLRAHTDGTIDYVPLGGMGLAMKSPSFTVGALVGYTFRSPKVYDKGKGVHTVIALDFVGDENETT